MGVESPGRSDGGSFRHAIDLVWEGWIDLKGDRISHFLLEARGHEELRWASPGFTGKDAESDDVAHLPAGHPIDEKCDVVYGIIGQPVLDSDAVEHEDDNDPSVRGPAIQKKMQTLQEGIQRWQSEGRDPSPIGEIMKEFEPLVRDEQFSDAERVLDRALKALDASGH